jgi:uncharacterized membrane protein YbhN (UPF0104 family)
MASTLNAAAVNGTWTALWRKRAVIAPIVLLAMLAILLVRSWGELNGATGYVVGADLRWMASAVLFQAMALSLIAMNYRRILARLGHQLAWRSMARAHLRRHVVATLIPFGSPASYVLFARDLAPKGVSGNDAVSAVVLYSAGGQAAFVLSMIGTVGWLALTSHLTPSVLALLAALPIAIVWVALPFVALRFGVDRMGRARFVPERVARLATRFAEHGLTPRDLLVPMLFSLAVNLTGFGMLTASLHAVGQSPSVATLLLVRLVAQIAAHAVPVMQGAGVVEFSMVGALQGVGVHASTAAAATVLFRGAQFWLPLALGLILFASVPRLRLIGTRLTRPRLDGVKLWLASSRARVNFRA